MFVQKGSVHINNFTNKVKLTDTHTFVCVRRLQFVFPKRKGLIHLKHTLLIRSLPGWAYPSGTVVHYTCVYTLCKDTLYYRFLREIMKNNTCRLFFCTKRPKLKARFVLYLIAVLAAFLLDGMHPVTFLLGSLSARGRYVTSHIPSSVNLRLNLIIIQGKLQPSYSLFFLALQPQTNSLSKPLQRWR